MTSGRIAVVGTKVFKLSSLSINRSNRLPCLDIEIGYGPFVFADLLLQQHIFWHAQWDKFNDINMFSSEPDADNVISVTEAYLKEEHKQGMEKAMEDYKQLCLKSFSLNRSGEVIQKQDLSLPRQVNFDTNPGKLQEMVNSTINHALINHSNVLSNTVYNTMV